jgi:hypothetical protein
MRGENVGVFEKIFGNKNKDIRPDGFFKMLNGYSPSFANAPESVYEMALIRAAIHSFATFVSKLKPEMAGGAKRHLEKTLQFRPNPFMDTSKYLYRLATIFMINNTAFIVPIEDDSGGIVGYFPILPQNTEILEVGGNAYMRYRFAYGQMAVIEFERVGILTKFQYSNDFFGENNSALRPTMQLISAQNQGIISAIKNGASIRFLAKVANSFKQKDIDELRKNFSQSNLSSENQTGLLIYDTKVTEVKPVDSKPITVNASQMAQINESVFSYYRTNAKIIQNSFTEDEWNAYYEGEIEPFALQLSLVHSNMTFTPREIAHGNEITFTANRLQFASNDTKLNISKELFDRGVLSLNSVMDIWNLPHVTGGEKRYIRGEYYEVDKLHKEGGGDDAGGDGQTIPGDAATNPDGGGTNQTPKQRFLC